MERIDKELIAHIKEGLRDHEEEYDAGAWERFSNPVPPRRQVKTWIYRSAAAAAAVVLIAFAFIKFNNMPDRTRIAMVNPGSKEHKATGLSAGPQQKPAEQAAPAVVMERPVLAGKKEIPNSLQATRKPLPATSTGRATLQPDFSIPAQTLAQENSPSLAQQKLPAQASTPEAAAKAVTAGTKTVAPAEATQPQPARKADAFETLLAANDREEGRSANRRDAAAERSLRVGMMVSPALGNDQKVNMGYGLAVTYALNKKVSLSSGLNYTSMSTHKDIALQPVAVQDFPMTSNFESTSANPASLESVNASIRGLSIPLEVRYHLSEKFYAGAGVAAMAILTQKHQNNYLVPKIAPETFVVGGGGVETRNVIVTEKQSKEVSSEEVNGARYLGFYNLSVGFRQKVSPKNTVALEPFLRIPMKDFSKENLNLTDAGLRLRFDF